ncbi:MAG: outer membrane protein assembly factor BamE [Acetobacteraceae bacterium]
MTTLYPDRKQRRHRLGVAPGAGKRRRFWILPLVGLALGAPLALGGCSVFQAPLEYRGQTVTGDELKQLVPGTTTESDVTALLGTPTSRGLFDPNRWAYMDQLTRARIGRFPGIVGQQVVILTFNDQGVLEKVQHLDGKEAVKVSMAGGATPSPGGSASFLQQLIGNVGRYSPAALPNGGTGGLSGGLPGE